ncbi:transmembrane protein [Cystoisospora suis]|uniref:Transmembrane protein n=1 Tax=Cystoisospora suis TaxID=483139 RepID=A0A2C6L3Q3_9APIC|nr:transmembrane protein [Cystoisospora suis]
MAGGGGNVLATITKWLGLVSGVMTVILWCFQLSSTRASISVNSHDFLSDVNKGTWRMSLFSFVPSVFVDIWTPFVMGAVSILCHLKMFHLEFITVNFAHFFAWNFVMALFGNIGYAGGVGIIVASFTLLTTLLSLICIIVCNEDASLQLG